MPVYATKINSTTAKCADTRANMYNLGELGHVFNLREPGYMYNLKYTRDVFDFRDLIYMCNLRESANMCYLVHPSNNPPL